MTPFILVSCLSAAHKVNWYPIEARPVVISADSDNTTSAHKRGPTCVVGECPAILVKDEPAFLPGLDLPAHLDEKAPAGFVGDGQMEAGVGAVSRRLDVAVKVEVVLPHREVAAQHAGLRQGERGSGKKKRVTSRGSVSTLPVTAAGAAGYLRSLLLPELHLPLHQLLPATRLLLQPLLQLLSSPPLLLQGLPAYLHLPLLHRPHTAVTAGSFYPLIWQNPNMAAKKLMEKTF